MDRDQDVVDVRDFLQDERPLPQTQERFQLHDVVITDIDIGFGHLVWLMLKLMLAAVPAFIALLLIMFVVGIVLTFFGLVGMSMIGQ